MKNNNEKTLRKDGTYREYSSFVCGSYARSGKSACTCHGISEDALNTIVTQQIRSHARLVKCDETRVISEILAQQNAEILSVQKTYQNEISAHQKRISKLNIFIEKLYEDRVNKIVPEDFFRRQLEKYENERAERLNTAEILAEKLSENSVKTDNAKSFAKIIKDFGNIEKLDAEILLLLVDKIIVGEAQKVGNSRICDVRICYNYVGNLDWLGGADNEKLYDVGAYIRLSVKDTDYETESASIESQRQILSQFIALMPGWNEKKFYIDNGFSGGNFNRPAFQEMLADARSGAVNLILVKDLSRFGRNYIEAGEYLENELPKLNCRFVAILDNVDTEEGENDIIPFINGLNDYYLKNLSEKIKTVLTAKAKNGEYLSGETPYGYRRNPENHTRLIVDKEVAETVKNIYFMRKNGLGYFSITRELNKQNILPPRRYYCKRENKIPPKNCTEIWQQQAVKSILRNEIYTGDSVRFKRKTRSYRQKGAVNRDEDECIRVPDTHEAIVDKRLWEEVQIINNLAKKRSENRKTSEPTLFSKLLVCPDCGNSFVTSVTNRTRKNGGTMQYVGYHCRTRSDSANGCSWHTVSEIALKQIVFSEIKRHAESLLLDENKMLKRLQNHLTGVSEKQNTTKKIRGLEQKLYALETHTAQLYEDRCEEMISDGRFSEMIADLEKKRSAAENELAALRKSEKERTEKLADIQKWAVLIKEKSSLEVVDRETLEARIDKIEVGEREVLNGEKRQSVRIFYKFVGTVD